MYLKLGLHGGLNCGIKHIYGFNEPEDLEPALDRCEPNYRDRHGEGFSVGEYHSEFGKSNELFHREAPEETTLERLDRYLQFLKGNRPSGIVEVTLAENQFDTWKNLLRRRGFRKVSEAVNSNSSKTIYVFHKILSGEF